MPFLFAVLQDPVLREYAKDTSLSASDLAQVEGKFKQPSELVQVWHFVLANTNKMLWAALTARRIEQHCRSRALKSFKLPMAPLSWKKALSSLLYLFH